MHHLFNKKTFLGLVGFVLVVSLFVYPGGIGKVDAEGGKDFLPLSYTLAPASGETVIIAGNSTWKFLDKGTAPGSGWLTAGFDDSTWRSGAALLGYGNGGEATVVSYGSNSSNKYNVTFFRKTFRVDNPANVSSLAIELVRDDGAVVFLNGKEVARSNMPTGTTSLTTRASDCVDGFTPSRIAIDRSALVAGTNVIAVAVHQCSATSSDLAFAMALYGKMTTTVAAPTPTPVAPNAAPTAAPTIAPTAAPTAVPLPSTTGRAYYVTTSGSASASGSASSPWSLAFALSHPSVLKPGDTIWVRGGTYNGAYTAKIKGTASAPITVRAYPGERVVLKRGDGPVLDIYDCAYLNLWGLEITGSFSTRSTSRSESTYGIRTYQGAPSHHIKFINMIVHDVQAQGFGWWQAMTDSEIYGSLFYYNGTTQLDHGIYLNNNAGTKALINSFVFDNASHGVHGYVESSGKYLNNIVLDGNTLFNNGSIGYNTSAGSYGIYKRNILVGGTVRTNYATITNNYTFYPGSAGISMNLGYSAGSANSRVAGNYLAGGEFDLGGTETSLTMTGNVVFAPGGYGGFSTSSYSNNTWMGNTRPTGIKIFVRPNRYEPNRANITVYNWDKATSVSLSGSSLSGVALKSGDRYELRNVQNYFSDVITGTYNGSSISIPMTNHSVAQPVGLNFRPASTFPVFGGFVLIVYPS
jgi:hypothetical protein